MVIPCKLYRRNSDVDRKKKKKKKKLKQYKTMRRSAGRVMNLLRNIHYFVPRTSVYRYNNITAKFKWTKHCTHGLKFCKSKTVLFVVRTMLGSLSLQILGYNWLTEPESDTNYQWLSTSSFNASCSTSSRSTTTYSHYCQTVGLGLCHFYESRKQ